MAQSWSVVEIAAGLDAEEPEEPLGTKQKFWVANPDDDRLWLFKFARVVGGETRGEDWAEWVVYRIAGLLGAPVAEVRPARCGGMRGIVSRSVVNPYGGERLVHGNSLLADADTEYDGDAKRENPGYSVHAIANALRGVSPPAAMPNGFTGFDVLAGYLILDALVAGRDRHHENWAVVSGPSGRSLSPSFDHGNALGFQERPEKMAACLSSADDMKRWALRGRSHHFNGRPTLVGLSLEALERTSAPAKRYWMHKVESLDVDEISDIVSLVPEDVMSDVSRRFVPELVRVNKERLIDGYRRS